LKGHGLIRRISITWSNFLAGEWKFPELPPQAMLEAMRLEVRWLNAFELKRAQWLWERRPVLILREDWPAYAFVVLIALAPLLIPVWGIAVSCAWMTLAFAAIFIDIVRLSRWRRDYEISIVRLLRQSEVEK
jgi:hypothetical protein